MQVLENNDLFTEFSVEESAAINGGRSDFNNAKKYVGYFLLSQTPASPGGRTVTTRESEDGWKLLIGYPNFKDDD